MKNSIKSKTSLLFSACALSLSGCFDIENKVILKKDTFSAEIALRFPKELMELGGDDDANGSRDPCEELKQAKLAQAENIKLESKVDVSEFHVTCRLSLSGPLDYELLAEKGSLDKLQAQSGDGNNAIEALGGGVVFKKISANKMRMTRKLKLNQKQMNRRGSIELPEGPRVADMREEDVMKLFLAGGSFRQVFEAEKIYATNGEFLVKDKVVEWKMPLSAAFTRGHELWVEFEIPGPWYKKMWSIFE